MPSSVTQKVSLGFEAHFSGELLKQNLTIPERVFLVPCELLAAIENGVQLPFLALDAISWELPTVALEKTARLLTGRKKDNPLQEAKEALPTTLTLLNTIYKVVGFVVGTVLSLTLGLCSSSQNHKVHAYFGLLTPQSLQTLQKSPLELRVDALESDVAALKQLSRDKKPNLKKKTNFDPSSESKEDKKEGGGLVRKPGASNRLKGLKEGSPGSTDS